VSNILGISAFYHDSAAAIIQNGVITAAVQEERFTRKKHDSAFPHNAIKYCLEFSGLSLNDLDAIVFYDKPFLKFERLLETYYAIAPKGLISFITTMPVWIKEKLFLKRLIQTNLSEIEKVNFKKMPLLFPEHHLSHAASAFYPSPFTKAAILTIDGVGEWATASICEGNGNQIKVLKELRFPNSVGLLYSAFTYYLGFKVNSGEYKLMGLSPYSSIDNERVQDFISIIKSELVDIKEDGSICMNQKYFNYREGITMVSDSQWEKLWGFPKRNSNDEIMVYHCHLAKAIQVVTEEIIIKMAKEAKRLTGADNLCMAGGVALNCVGNGKLLLSGIVDKIFIQPAAGDAGGAIGAALAAYHIYLGKERKTILNAGDGMQGSYLGPSCSNREVEVLSEKYNAVHKNIDGFGELCEQTARLIAEGNVIGWVQGRMEFGPRALGSRSILADPRNPAMQKKVNMQIKFRESFRPFASSVLAEDAALYFKLNGSSTYMLMVADLIEEKRKKLPPNYNNLSMNEKLYFLKSDIPAVTHVDFSSRVQTVDRNINPGYWELISCFKKLTGCSVLLNTSFNVRGEPVVCTPEDAYKCFMRTEMDYLVINNYIYRKVDQPAWNENSKEEFLPD